MEDNTDYFPTDEAGTRQLLLSLKTKAPNYRTQLDLSTAKLQEFADRSDLYEFLIDNSELLENSKEAFSTAKDIIVNGTPGTTIPVLPSITVPVPPVALMVGIIKSTRKDVAKMKLADGYTAEIGIDLGIKKAPGESISPENFAGEAKLRTLTDYQVEGVYKKKGMSGMRFEYRRKGGAWQVATNALGSPVVFRITPTTPGEAEQIEIRVIYLDKNTPFGQYSPTYSVVIAP